jgi:hypothetical protein
VIVSSRFLTWAMAPLMLAIGADLYVVDMLVTDSIPFSATLIVAAVVLLAGLWFVFPWRSARNPLAPRGRLA